VPGRAPTVYATGFTTITDLAFSRAGHLLVLEYNTSGLTSPTGAGALVEVSPNGTQTTLTTALTDPTGMAVGPDGSIYVSNNGDSPTAGQILRFAYQPGCW
jgi:sugar lactone lactonase YvrE